jgi:hypothetical protein
MPTKTQHNTMSAFVEKPKDGGAHKLKPGVKEMSDKRTYVQNPSPINYGLTFFIYC